MLGEVIGNHRVVRQLGSGGMGEVYLAEHETIRTKIAVKVLYPHISKEKNQVERFFNEARAVAEIRHAGIVKIYDVGFTASRQAYLLMELLEGEALSARIERGRLVHGEACEIARQVASVLAATHDAGIVHRDLKPDNVFLIRDQELPGGERVKVLDFGIAKLTGLLAPKKATLSQSTMGTPMYMSPEQAGDASKVDGRADIYSLGCMVFEMVCGRPPFEASSTLEALSKHISEPPPTARSIAPEVSPVLDVLVSRMLAKAPADRPQTMRELVSAFADLAAGGTALVRSMAAVPTIRPVASPPATSTEITMRPPPGAVARAAGPRPKTPILARDTPSDQGERAVAHDVSAEAWPGMAVASRDDMARGATAPASPPAVIPAGSQPPVSEPDFDDATEVTAPPLASSFAGDDSATAPRSVVNPARLVVVSPNFAGTELKLTKTASTIGRASDNDFVLDHRSIAPLHAQIVREPSGRTSITSVGGSGAVRVNGVVRIKAELQRGDAIDLGDVRLRFVDLGESFVFSRDARTEMPQRRRRWPWAVGGTVGLGAAAAVVVVLASRGEPRAKATAPALDASVVVPVPIDGAPPPVPIDAPPGWRERLEKANPFIELAPGSGAIQHGLVAREYYDAFIEEEPPAEREALRPLLGWPDSKGSAPSAATGIAFAQARAFCKAVRADADLPSEDELRSLARTLGGFDRLEELREWTRTDDGKGLVKVREPARRWNVVKKTTDEHAPDANRTNYDLGFRCTHP